MAQPFDKRLATGLQTNAANVETLQALISETEAEREKQSAILERADAESIDPLLNESDRDAAAALAQRSGRMVRAYSDALKTLREKLEIKLESDARQAADAERAAALKERDELAKVFVEVVLDPIEKMIDVFELVRENTRRLEAAGVKGEADAEAKARNVPAHYYNGHAPIDRFVMMKIPGRHSGERQWPVDRAAIATRQRLYLQASDRAREAAAARRPEAIEARRAEEDKKFGSYRLSTSEAAQRFSFVPRGASRQKTVRIWRDPLTVELRHTDAERARAMGLTVRPATEKAAA